MPTISISAACELLDVEAERVRQLISDGHIRRTARGRLVMEQAVRGFVSALRDEAERTSTSATASRVQAARARALELKNAVADGTLFDFIECQDILAEVFGGAKSGIYGVPARVSRDLDFRRQAETVIDGALNGICDHFAREADRLKAELGDAAR